MTHPKFDDYRPPTQKSAAMLIVEERTAANDALSVIDSRIASGEQGLEKERHEALLRAVKAEEEFLFYHTHVAFLLEG